MDINSNTTWSIYETANKPYRRCGLAVVEISGLAYLFGGYHEDIDKEIVEKQIFNQKIDTNIYYPKTNQFQYDIANDYAPLLCYGHTCTVYKQFIYLWGGRIYPSELTTQIGDSNVYRYDPKENTWSIVLASNIPPSRYGHSACVIGDAMYVFGGYVHKQNKCCNKLYKFDFLKNNWTKFDSQTDTSVPRPRFLHTTTAVGASLYVYGGRCYESNSKIDKPYNSTSSEIMHRYDTTTSKWSVIAYLPIGLRAHSAVAYKNKILIFGGYYKCDYQNSLFIFDTDLVSCFEINLDQFISRGKHACCLFNDQLYLFGGTGHLNRNNNNKDDDDAAMSEFLYKFDLMCMFDELESNKENLDENMALAFNNFMKSYKNNDEQVDEFFSMEILNEFGCHYISKIQVIHI